MWQAKRKVADGDPSAMKLGLSSSASSSGSRGSKRKGKGGKRVDRQLRKFFNTLGTSIESLIDATPLGVQTPEPWNPSTDRKKAFLSNPISVLNNVSEGIDALSRAKLFERVGGSAHRLASSKVLMSIREGLAHAALVEKEMGEGPEGMEVTVEVPMSGDAFVDVGADRWGNSSRTTNPAKEALAEAKAIKDIAVSKIIAFIDNMTLRANGIVVTSDDCSVECSLASLVGGEFETCSPPDSVPKSIHSDDDDFEECPSVITEIVEDRLDSVEGDKSDKSDEVNDREVEAVGPPVSCTQELVSDEDEYVMAEEPDSDEDFVDVDGEFDI